MSDHHDQTSPGGSIDDLASTTPIAPPPELRHRVMAAVTTNPRPAPPQAIPAAAFGRAVEAMADLLNSLEPQDWVQPAAPYRWSVHGLVAHLAVIERYTTAALGLGRDLATVEAELGGDPADHLGLGSAVIDHELTVAPDRTADRWLIAAEELAALAGDLSADQRAKPVTVHQWPMSVDSALVARTFEVWTHADDIRRAVGRASVAPPAEDLAVMSATSINSLTLALAVVDDTDRHGMARFVLTGRGGTTFRVSIGDGPSSQDGNGDELVTVVTDVVDYCRMAARRIDPDDLDADIIGDADLARSLFTAARLVAL